MPENTAPLTQEPLAVGDLVLDRYRIVERMTEGGHSLVYRGLDERLSRPVCVKVFHRRTDNDGVFRTSYEHFVQEAFALSKLTHPNTLRIYDFGHLGEEASGGAPFQVSEYINGGTLSRRIRTDGPIEAEESATLLDGLCGALAEAHHRGITHRDIKPQNVLFLQSGARRTAKLADFGIAKLGEADELAFRAGDTSVIAGRALLMLSPAWAAPEQMTGDSVGPWSDIYSMALIATYMTSGVALFACADADEAYRLRADSTQHIEDSLRDRGLPASFVDLIQRACDIDPANRPPTVEAFARDLSRALRPHADHSGPNRLLPLPSPPAEAEARPPTRRERVSLTNPPTRLGDRQVGFLSTEKGVAVVESSRARVELSMMVNGDRVMAHLKPRTCFVAIAGKRPSSAVQLADSEFVDFVLPNMQPIARARLCFGRAAAGHIVFELGDVDVAVPADECGHAVVLDFGPGTECYFVYQPGRALAPAEPGGKARPRRRQGPR